MSSLPFLVSCHIYHFLRFLPLSPLPIANPAIPPNNVPVLRLYPTPCDELDVVVVGCVVVVAGVVVVGTVVRTELVVTVV